jgi:hypothetical protein
LLFGYVYIHYSLSLKSEREAVILTPRYLCLASILILASSCAFGADSYKPNTDNQRQEDFRATGSATNINRRAEVFDIVDHGDTFTILADRATVQLSDGKFGTVSDIKDNAQVRVTGEQLSSRTVMAGAVILLDDTGSIYGSSTQSYQPNDRVETTGYATRCSPRANEIDVRTRSGNYVVIVGTGTVIRRYIYATDINDINDGDDLNITGTVDHDGRIVAERIQVTVSKPDERGKYPIGKGYQPRASDAAPAASEDLIEGTVAYPVSSFDRTLGLSTKYGDRKVDVPKNAEVFIDRRAASIHDLMKGDKIRASGTWSGSTLVASRVETIDELSASPTVEEKLPAPEPPPAAEPAPSVEAPAPAEPTAPAQPSQPAEPTAQPTPPTVEAPRPSTFTGRIIEIDYAKFELSVDAGMKDTKIDAGNAAITRKGSSRRFSELKKGDKVEVKGDWDGDVLKAAAVDVVE